MTAWGLPLLWGRQATREWPRWRANQTIAIEGLMDAFNGYDTYKFVTIAVSNNTAQHTGHVGRQGMMISICTCGTPGPRT